VVTCLRCRCNQNLRQLEAITSSSPPSRSHFRAGRVVDSRSLPNTVSSGVRAAEWTRPTSLVVRRTRFGFPRTSSSGRGGGGGEPLPGAPGCGGVGARVGWRSVKCCNGRPASLAGVSSTAAAVLISVAPERTPLKPVRPVPSGTCGRRPVLQRG
jgi:hypothetical protein